MILEEKVAAAGAGRDPGERLGTVAGGEKGSGKSSSAGGRRESEKADGRESEW